MSRQELTAAALDVLYHDALDIYERARQEVFIQRSDGTQQRYAATRYQQPLDKGHAENTLVPTIAKVIRRPTLGFSHLENARRPDLMLETLVSDETKPYHGLFTRTTVETARARLKAYEEGHRAR